ncbi:hypothetical protein IAS59_006454 [Cryptococcus gattii]
MSANEVHWVEPTEAPARDADSETCWNFIAAGVRRIVTGSTSDSQSISDHYYSLLSVAEKLDSLPDDQLFQVYALRWGRYTAAATRLDKLFSCFNGNWTRNQHIAKRDSVFTVGMLARVTWKQHVYQHLVERVLEQAIDSYAYFGFIRPRVLGLAPRSPYLAHLKSNGDMTKGNLFLLNDWRG